MKKALGIFVLIFIFALPLWAADLSATGYGRTLDEARTDAKIQLAGSISTHVSNIVSVQTEEDSTGRSFFESFFSSSVHESEFELKGTIESNPQNVDNTWQITLTLPSSAAPVYYDDLIRLNRDITQLYGRLGNLEDYRAVTDKQYEQLLNLLEAYEATRLVAIQLDPSKAADIAELPVSLTVVETQYDAKKQEELNALMIEYASFDELMELGLISEEQMSNYDDLRDMIAERKKSDEERIREQQEKTAEMLREAQAAFSNDANIDYEALLSESGSKSLTDIINSVESRRRSFKQVKGIMDQRLGTIYNSMQQDCRDFYDARMSEPYAAIDMEKKGFIFKRERPTDEAVETRKKGVNAYIEDNIMPQYVNAASDEYKLYVQRLSTITRAAMNDLAELNGTEYTYNTYQNQMAVAISGYNRNTNAFTGYVSLTIGSQSARFDFEIPYKVWFGKEMPEAEDDIFEYENARIVASDWMNRLMSDTSILLVEVKFTVKGYLDGSKYDIAFKSFNIARLDTGDVIIRDKAVGKKVTVNLWSEDSTDLSSYAPEEDDAKAMISYMDASSIEDEVLKVAGITDDDIAKLKYGYVPPKKEEQALAKSSSVMERSQNAAGNSGVAARSMKSTFESVHETGSEMIERNKAAASAIQSEPAEIKDPVDLVFSFGLGSSMMFEINDAEGTFYSFGADMAFRMGMKDLFAENNDLVFNAGFEMNGIYYSADSSYPSYEAVSGFIGVELLGRLGLGYYYSNPSGMSGGFDLNGTLSFREHVNDILVAVEADAYLGLQEMMTFGLRFRIDCYDPSYASIGELATGVFFRYYF